MPVAYNPDPTAAQPPSPAPTLNEGVNPILNLPEDGVDDFSASTWDQAFKVAGDWITFLKQRLALFLGIRYWRGTDTFGPGMVVVNLQDARIYRGKATSLNQRPDVGLTQGESDYWARCDYSEKEIRQIGATHISALTGWTVSHGASISQVDMLTFDMLTLPTLGLFKFITFRLINVPADSYCDVDLNGATTKLYTILLSAQVSMMTGGSPYGGMVGTNPNIGSDPNVLRVWYKKGAGDSGSLCDVAVTIIGV